MEDFASETALWLDGQDCVELELGCLVSAASEWTEDETELDDLVSGLLESGRVEVLVGEFD